MTNYSVGHESRAWGIGDDRLAYPDAHVEVDNRLSWMLGRLDRAYGDQAVYVHLTRDDADVARSFERRLEKTNGIINAYAKVLIIPKPKAHPWSGREAEVCLDYCDTVNSNIAAFLKDKPHQLRVQIEAPEAGFRQLWELIDGQGDLHAALAEFDARHHAYTPPEGSAAPRAGLVRRIARKAKRILARR